MATDAPSSGNDASRAADGRRGASSVLDAIEDKLPALTPAQRRVAQVISQGYPELVFATAEEISARASVSRSTFLRTLAALDHPGLVELQGQVRRELADLLAPPDRWKTASVAGQKDVLDVVNEIAAFEKENIETTFARLPGDIKAAARLMTRAKRVFVMGERKGRALATYFAVQLAQMRGDVVDMSAGEFGLQVADLRMTDTVVLFDLRRHGRATHTVGTLASRAGASVVLIGDSLRPPTARLADVFLVFETKTASPFLSYTAGFALVNALVALIVNELGSAGEEYAKKAESVTEALSVFEGQAGFGPDVHLSGGGRTGPPVSGGDA